MIEVELTNACRQEGCPVCRLRQQREAHYLRTILSEYVMDVGFRIRFVRSEGLCLDHAWLLQTLEQTTENDGLGTGILYDALLQVIRRQLGEQSQRLAAPVRPWWHPARWRKQSPDRAAAPVQPCPVCANSRRTEESYCYFLAEFLQQASWRTVYEANDGLCLPHLRRVLSETTPETAQWLLTNTGARLDQLQHDLKEYLRKHSYQFHDEPMPEGERSSWLRAVAFSRGEQPHSRESLVRASPVGENTDERQPGEHPAAAA